jgi:heme ABC exporter ATP-binding subunit CcmA
MADPIIRIQDVSRRFGRVWAVRKVSLDVAPGEVLVLQGHNGSGKSTLLRMMAGVLRPTEGEVHVLGQNLNTGLGPVGASIGWLDHRPALYPDLTGRENLRFWSRLAGSEASEDATQAALERVALKAVSHRPVRGWSRGMMQRLALAGLILRDARVWLLDEPTTGLDAEGRQVLRELLAEGRSADRAVVVITHDPSSLGDVVDRQLGLDRGRLADVEGAS